jgi:hypothetical protein
MQRRENASGSKSTDCMSDRKTVRLERGAFANDENEAAPKPLLKTPSPLRKSAHDPRNRP